MLKLYDSLTRKTESFPPEHAGPVTIYACGPTVYHYATIGNLRTFLTVDLLRRYLEYRGKEVRLVMNITDVGHMLNDAEKGEDKIEAAARKEGKTQEEIARFYEKAFFDDLEKLNFKKAGTRFPRATENVEGEGGMIELVRTLLDKGLAYPTGKGDVYYDVAKFKKYGELSGNTVEKLKAGARVEVQEDKRHPADFALWIHNDAHQMQWEFDWKDPETGETRHFKGYPGWHLECSAMAQKYLGETIDLHCGGEDLKFPHHECEIAQSEGATGRTFAKHWLHVTYLLVDGEKMSKSKGNFYTLQDLLDKGYSAAAVRWLLLSAHYRTQLNFTLQALETTEQHIRSLRNTYLRWRETAGGCELKDVSPSQSSFHLALGEDLNVSSALAILHVYTTMLNKQDAEGVLGKEEAAIGLNFLDAFQKIFGIDLAMPPIEVPEEITALAQQRQAARSEKRWADSDRLRDEIAARGWTVEDTPQGQRLKKS